jgi:hypothetical protein
MDWRGIFSIEQLLYFSCTSPTDLYVSPRIKKGEKREEEGKREKEGKREEDRERECGGGG